MPLVAASRSARSKQLILLITLVFGMGVSRAQGPAPQCPVQPDQSQALADEIKKTVVITEAAAMPNFTLSRTLSSIIESTPGHTGAATDAERIALLQSLIASFSQTKFVNPDSHVAMTLNTRPGEAALSPAKLLDPSDADGMHPVGLFNRLDLAPENLQHCGQHRIVYAKGHPPLKSTNRFFLIFEAALDNPVDDADPSKRLAGCREVARFWDGLKAKSGPDLASALDDFYYKGLVSTNPAVPSFKPVVHFLHYGSPDGQVRGNLFVNSQLFSWELREWRLVTASPGKPSFEAATVKDNPIAELYGAQNAVDPFDSLKDPFKTNFVDSGDPDRAKLGTLLQQLVSYDQRVLKSGKVDSRNDELSAVVAMDVPNKFNDFQSVASGTGLPSDDPAILAPQSDISARIAAKLNDLQACKITAQHILNRAGANSCAGCHQFSLAKEIAPGVPWPASLGFVQIDEEGQLSPALLHEFLPARRRSMERVLQPPAAALTVSVPDIAFSNFVEIRSNLQNLQSLSGSRSGFLEGAAKLEKQVVQAREIERAMPGAFVAIRRTH